MKTESGLCLFLITSLTFLACTSQKKLLPELGAHPSPVIHKQWSVSYHARSVRSSENWSRKIQKGCAHCHTADGYQLEFLQRKESAAPYEETVGLTCEACHSDGGRRGKLRVQDKNLACGGCHDELVSNTSNYLSWCSQGALVSGTGGAEFEGQSAVNGAHSRLKKNCITCHMASPPEGPDGEWVGGHSFRVISKGVSPRVFNSGPCDRCHLGLTLEAVEQFQSKIQSLLDNLESRLPFRTIQTGDSSHAEPRYPADPALSSVQSMAAYNFYMIQKDGTLGVHNPKYIRLLLEDSIRALDKEN